ncbi:MAG: nitroreductase [Atopobiaceae bacterium]|jgi:nitroreductase|nr:nitroreductase [Atopobiaceae bacterium]MCI2173604.1 nitroreductase [Atopobiaceae bacterium]MCI2207754.1 nitroreductase [Atopobiaceae bacterium]
MAEDIAGVVLENMMGRRSCRRFTTEQVADEQVEKVVDAGRWAPSGMGRQPVRFVVLRDADAIKHLSHMNASVMGTSGDPFYGAPTVIVVLADPAAPTFVNDGSLAMGNMLNEAHALGLGSCWIHRAKEEFESPDGKALLREWGLSEDLVGIGHCILGHPADSGCKDAAERRGGTVVWV